MDLWSTLEYSSSQNTIQYITYTVSSDIATGGFTQELKNNLLGKLATQYCSSISSISLPIY